MSRAFPFNVIMTTLLLSVNDRQLSYLKSAKDESKALYLKLKSLVF